jgi:transposase
VRSLRAGDLSAVHVPDVDDEAFRDLARAWAAAKADLRQSHQRLKSFLLAHDVRYTGNADWGPAHRRWVSTFAFANHWQQLAFDECRRTIEDRLAQCDRLEAALREAVVHWRFYPAVLGLQTMRGVQFITAIGMLSELGDLSRFEHPRQLMAWLGVTPSEHSSGDRRRQGSITKNGNSYARKLLVEAAWSYRYPARVSPDIQRRHEKVSPSPSSTVPGTHRTFRVNRDRFSSLSPMPAAILRTVSMRWRVPAGVAYRTYHSRLQLHCRSEQP